MATNVLIFHGTEGYPEENWFPWLKQQLEQLDCQVFVPQFPSPPVVPARIDEWWTVLKGYTQHINGETILIGHSLGGDFGLRVLETLRQPIRAALFVGTPVGVQPILNYDRDVAFCGFNFQWDVIRRAAQSFAVYQSDDDPYVCFDNGKVLAEKLGVELSFIPNAGHFNAKAGYTTFPELYETVRKILGR